MIPCDAEHKLAQCEVSGTDTSHSPTVLQAKRLLGATRPSWGRPGAVLTPSWPASWGRAGAIGARRGRPAARRDEREHQATGRRRGRGWHRVDWRWHRVAPDGVAYQSTGCQRLTGAVLATAPTASPRPSRPDAHGRNLVFLEVDLGHYSRERVLGKVKAFLDNPDARSIVLVTRTRERARRLGDWVRAYGRGVMRRVQPLTFERVKTGGVLRRGTEPLPPERANARAV
jgi:hypothetical protein